MSKFAEEVLYEAPQMVKRKTWRKDVSYRTRVVRRKIDGIMRKMVDIREWVVNEKKCLFTESGVYFTQEELEVLIPMLIGIKNKYFKKGKPNETRGTRSGVPHSRYSKEKEKLS